MKSIESPRRSRLLVDMGVGQPPGTSSRCRCRYCRTDPTTEDDTITTHDTVPVDHNSMAIQLPPPPPQTKTTKEQLGFFSHADVEWILRPSQPITVEEMELFQQTRNTTTNTPGAVDPGTTTTSTTTMSFLEFPLPRDGKVVLECWIPNDDDDDDDEIASGKVEGEKEENSSDSSLNPTGGKKKKKVGRFGITARAGPPHPAMLETIQTLLDNPDLTPPLYVGAIIYMFVQEDYRQRGIGHLALQAISWIHAQIHCGYTVLVADDNGSGKLVAWYEDHGFVQAPLLQDVLGSPDGIYGVTMIGPASGAAIPESFRFHQVPDA